MIDQASISIFVAAIGALVALMTVIITKEQKVSEFRQAWIDGLRADIAEAISAASTLSLVLQIEEVRPSADKLREWSRLTAALARIELRLNMTKTPHQQLENCIRRSESLLERIEKFSEDYDQKEWQRLQADTVLASQELLSIEWKRVKAGELIFRVAKIVLILAVAGGLIAFGIALFG